MDHQRTTLAACRSIRARNSMNGQPAGLGRYAGPRANCDQHKKRAANGGGPVHADSNFGTVAILVYLGSIAKRGLHREVTSIPKSATRGAGKCSVARQRRSPIPPFVRW